MKQETLDRIQASCKGPSKLEAKAMGNNLDLYLYGEIMPDVSPDYPSPTSARAFREALSAAPDIQTINLYINSPGGYTQEGNAIYTMLKRHPARVNVYVDGDCFSMASAIAMAGDKITMSPVSTMMIHNTWMWVCGNPTDLRKAADDLDVINNSIKQAYLLKTGDKLGEEKLQSLMDDETFLTPKQCLEYGLCDEVEFMEESNYEEKLALLQDRLASIEAKLALQEKKSMAPKEEDNNKPAETGWFF